MAGDCFLHLSFNVISFIFNLNKKLSQALLLVKPKLPRTHFFLMKAMACINMFLSLPDRLKFNSFRLPNVLIRLAKFVSHLC